MGLEMREGDGQPRKARGHRKRHIPPLKKRNINLTDEQCKLVRSWGRGDLSAGLRWLITAAAPLIKRKSELDEFELRNPPINVDS